MTLGSPLLRRFWVQFADPRRVSYGLGPGCGVTASSLDDALALISARVFRGPMPFEVSSVTEDVDVRTLDAGHVLPNMNLPHVRGVWFPLGYD